MEGAMRRDDECGLPRNRSNMSLVRRVPPCGSRSLILT